MIFFAELILNPSSLDNKYFSQHNSKKLLALASQQIVAPQCSEFHSVSQSCPTLCDPMDCTIPGLPVHHQFPEFTQTHVH